MATAQLYGSLSRKDGEFVVSGKWAFSAEDYKNGKHNKFSLTGPATGKDGDVPKQLELNGFFVVNKEGDDGTKKVKVHERRVWMAFSKTEGSKSYAVEGSGKNKYGRFKLAGRYDPVSHKLMCSKAYESTGDDDDEDDGGFVEDLDRDEIADELAALKEDAEYHGLVLGAEQGSASKTSKRRRHKPAAPSKSTDAPAEPSNKKQKVSADPEDDEEEDDEDFDEDNPDESDDEGESDDEDDAEAEHKEGAASAENGAGEAEEDKSDKLWDPKALAAAHATLQAAVANGNPKKILKALHRLKRGGKVSVELLTSCTIGKDVRHLKKHADPAVATAAGELVAHWKSILSASA